MKIERLQVLSYQLQQSDMSPCYELVQLIPLFLSEDRMTNFHNGLDQVDWDDDDK